MRVGALEETITVTGETPIVDVQNTKRQRVIDREIIDNIPTSRTAYDMASLIPGVSRGGLTNQDVGGSSSSGNPIGSVAVHGRPHGRSDHAAQRRRDRRPGHPRGGDPRARAQPGTRTPSDSSGRSRKNVSIASFQSVSGTSGTSSRSSSSTIIASGIIRVSTIDSSRARR